MADSLTVVLVYPELLGTYGDVGNAQVLVQRARWRGVSARVERVGVADAVPAYGDVYVLGGGEDQAQLLAVNRLRAQRGLHSAVAAGAPVLAVCAGLQLLGWSFVDGAGLEHAGLGLLDCRSDRLGGPRAVGELLTQPRPEGIPLLTGFENHQGRTVLGRDATPFGDVVSGVGNGDGTDGAVAGSIVATYAHGPVLARNPALADSLLSRVMGAFEPIDDEPECALRRERIRTVTSNLRRRRGASVRLGRQ